MTTVTDPPTHSTTRATRPRLDTPTRGKCGAGRGFPDLKHYYAAVVTKAGDRRTQSVGTHYQQPGDLPAGPVQDVRRQKDTGASTQLDAKPSGPVFQHFPR